MNDQTPTRRSGGRSARREARSNKLPDELRPIRAGMEGGKYKPLSDIDVQKIHQAALTALETIGLADAPPSGVEILTGAGAILGADGPVPFGVEGTIAIDKHDAGLMLGYLGAPDETAAKYQGDWFLTGDQGCMDASGQITYLGRADDMMNAGGYRVSPLEVEAAMLACSGVTQAAVAEVEVRDGVRVIAGFYVAHADLNADLEETCSHMLAKYKRPRMFIRLDVLPMGANNKIQRKALRNWTVT